MVSWKGNQGEVFSRDHTPEGRTETNKSLFCPYKQVGEMVITNNLE